MPRHNNYARPMSKIALGNKHILFFFTHVNHGVAVVRRIILNMYHDNIFARKQFSGGFVRIYASLRVYNIPRRPQLAEENDDGA